MPDERIGHYRMRIHGPDRKLQDQRIWQRDEDTGIEKVMKDFKLQVNKEAWGGGIPKG